MLALPTTTRFTAPLRLETALRFHRKRLAAGITHHELARRSGIHIDTVIRLERGTARASRAHKLAWSRACAQPRARSA